MGEVIIGVTSVVGGILGCLFGYLGYTREMKKNAIEMEKNAKNEGQVDGELKADISYIKRGVEDIRVDQKAAENRMIVLGERITRCEESSKQAHKRIDDHVDEHRVNQTKKNPSDASSDEAC